MLPSCLYYILPSSVLLRLFMSVMYVRRKYYKMEGFCTSPSNSTCSDIMSVAFSQSWWENLHHRNQQMPIRALPPLPAHWDSCSTFTGIPLVSTFSHLSSALSLLALWQQECFTFLFALCVAQHSIPHTVGAKHFALLEAQKEAIITQRLCYGYIYVT